MHVDAIDRAVVFFTEVLAFKVGFRFDDHVSVYRENVGVRMLQNRESSGARNDNSFYCDCCRTAAISMT